MTFATAAQLEAGRVTVTSALPHAEVAPAPPPKRDIDWLYGLVEKLASQCRRSHGDTLRSEARIQELEARVEALELLAFGR